MYAWWIWEFIDDKNFGENIALVLYKKDVFKILPRQVLMTWDERVFLVALTLEGEMERAIYAIVKSKIGLMMFKRKQEVDWFA